MYSLKELKDRKIVQWALAYLAGAWVLIEVTDLVGDHFGWPSWIHRVLIVLAGGGLLLTLVLAWYHGEKGRQRVSGPELLMVAGILVLAGAAIALVRERPADQPGTTDESQERVTDDDLRVPASERSIAVLPFDNLSPDPQDEYFVRGMHEAILTALANLEELNVTSRTSVTRYDETEKSVREIAGELGVAHVLEGSVQRAGERVRVTAQLIDARSDRHLWTESYDREYSTDGVFDIQTQVARQVAAALEARLSPGESRHLTRRPTASLTAYDFYLRAQDHLHLNTREAVRSAVRLYHRALDLDPEFALAHAGLAEAFARLETLTGRRFWLDDSLTTYAQRALEIDPDLPEARMALARYHEDHGEFRDSMHEVRRVLAQRPNHARAAQLLGGSYRSMGPDSRVAALDQSLCWMRLAVRLEPNLADNHWWLADSYLLLADFTGAERVAHQGLTLQPDALRLYAVLVQAALARGERATALERYRTARSVASTSGPDLQALGLMELALGRVDSARVHLAGISDRFEGFPMQAAYAEFAYALWRTGERGRARDLLDRRGAVTERGRREEIAGFWAEFDQAELHAIRGEREPALDLMEEAVEEGWRHYVRILPEIDTPFRELWDEPRFHRLMDRVKADVESMRLRVEREGCETIRALPAPSLTPSA